ncbi:MAG: hypothetical protein IPQ00_03260 [Chloracidobacterium sp.]|nr:hypothetical protein [Chloracidobacterium sp.]
MFVFAAIGSLRTISVSIVGGTFGRQRLFGQTLAAHKRDRQLDVDAVIEKRIREHGACDGRNLFGAEIEHVARSRLHCARVGLEFFAEIGGGDCADERGDVHTADLRKGFST